MADVKVQERLQRAEEELKEARNLADEIIRGKYEGRERGAAYRHLNSLCLHVNQRVRRLTNPRRKDYDARIASKANEMIDEADDLYDRAWKAHH